jgi:hypothetical protein
MMRMASVVSGAPPRDDDIFAIPPKPTNEYPGP